MTQLDERRYTIMTGVYASHVRKVSYNIKPFDSIYIALYDSSLQAEAIMKIHNCIPRVLIINIFNTSLFINERELVPGERSM